MAEKKITKIFSSKSPPIASRCVKWKTHPEDVPIRGEVTGEGQLPAGVEPKGECEYTGEADLTSPVIIANQAIDGAIAGGSEGTGGEGECCCHCPCYPFDGDLVPALGPKELALVDALPYEMDDYPGRLL